MEPLGFGMTRSAAPPIRNEPASVTMIAGSRASVTMAPVAAPIAAPVATTARPPSAAPPSVSATSVAASTQPRLTIAPIARSIPPISMTSVCAIATSAIGNQF